MSINIRSWLNLLTVTPMSVEVKNDIGALNKTGTISISQILKVDGMLP